MKDVHKLDDDATIQSLINKPKEKCKICERLYVSLELHSKESCKKNQERRQKEILKIKNGTVKEYKCEKCDAIFKQNENLKNHIRNQVCDRRKERRKKDDNKKVHTRKTFPCQFCGKEHFVEVKQACKREQERRDIESQNAAPLYNEKLKKDKEKNMKRKTKQVFDKITYEDVDILSKDYKYLDRRNEINDSLINFYFKYLKNTQNESFKQVFVYSTLFFVDLKKYWCQESNDFTDYDRIRKWTRKTNIFIHDALIIPVNEKLRHWYLIIVSFKLNKILILDSFPEQEKRGDKDCFLLRKYFAKELKLTDMNSSQDFQCLKQENPKVLLQNNHKDCGIFILQYAESFVKNLERNFLAKDLTDLFYEYQVLTKREDIAKIIKSIARKSIKDLDFIYDFPHLKFR